MSRPAELFAVGAILLLAAGLISRLAHAPNQGFVTVHARGSAYGFSIETVRLFMAAFFAVFAAIYSFWVIPMSQTAAASHFWLTAAGTVLFWTFFLAFSRAGGSGEAVVAKGVTTAYLLGWVLLLAGQVMFVTNLVATLLRGHRA